MVSNEPAALAEGRVTRDQRQICGWMDDPTGPQLGFTPVAYAFMMLRTEFATGGPPLSEMDALQAISDAAHDYCPQNLADLPEGWR